MAAISEVKSGQGIGRRVVLDSGEAIVINLIGETQGWRNGGGLSWSINPDVEDTDINVAVHHSLALEGDDWIPDEESPFEEPVGGNEVNRINRIRFRNDGVSTVHVGILSPAKFTHEFA